MSPSRILESLIQPICHWAKQIWEHHSTVSSILKLNLITNLRKCACHSRPKYLNGLPPSLYEMVAYRPTVHRISFRVVECLPSPHASANASQTTTRHLARYLEQFPQSRVPLNVSLPFSKKYCVCSVMQLSLEKASVRSSSE